MNGGPFGIVVSACRGRVLSRRTVGFLRGLSTREVVILTPCRVDGLGTGTPVCFIDHGRDVGGLLRVACNGRLPRGGSRLYFSRGRFGVVRLVLGGGGRDGVASALGVSRRALGVRGFGVVCGLGLEHVDSVIALNVASCF